MSTKNNYLLIDFSGWRSAQVSFPTEINVKVNCACNNSPCRYEKYYLVYPIAGTKLNLRHHNLDSCPHSEQVLNSSGDSNETKTTADKISRGRKKLLFGLGTLSFGGDTHRDFFQSLLLNHKFTFYSFQHFWQQSVVHYNV